MKSLLRGLSLATVLIALAGCSSLMSSFSPSNIMDTVIGAGPGQPVGPRHGESAAAGGQRGQQRG